MPDVVLKNKNKDVGNYVLSVPNGVDVETHFAEGGWANGGWSIDKGADAAAETPPSVVATADIPADPNAPADHPEGA